MYPIPYVPGYQAWPWFWAASLLTVDLLTALLELPAVVITYIVNVLRGLTMMVTRVFVSKRSDVPEPPHLWTTVPFFGHLYNIFTQGSKYVQKLEAKYKLPLFSITVPGYRVYVAAAPEAARAINKHPKLMEFTEIQRIAMRKLFYYPEEAIDTLGIHLNGDGTLKLINKPGPELDEVNVKGQVELARLINTFGRADGSPLELCSTLRKMLTSAICSALWGSEYPLLYDDSLEEDFWTWVHHFWWLLILPAHSITVRTGHAARERLCAALLKYTQAGGHRLASRVVSAEYHLYKSLGLGEDIVARAGTVSLFVVLSNTVMAGLWMVMIVFSRPDLLDQIRKEVADCTTIEASKDGQQEQRTINSTKLKTDCPLLLATLRETLRLYMDFSLNRYVAADAQVRLPNSDKTFLLRKDSIVQIASPLLQNLPSIWGPDVEEFKPSRFMEKQAEGGCPYMAGSAPTKVANDSETRSRVYGANVRTSVPDVARPVHVTKDQKTAFGVCGQGNHTCPGRHFAFHIIAAFVAVLVSGFDIKGADGSVLVPPHTEQGLGHGIKFPEGNVEAAMTKREGYENVQWDFEL